MYQPEAIPIAMALINRPRLLIAAVPAMRSDREKPLAKMQSMAVLSRFGAILTRFLTPFSCATVELILVNRYL